MTLMERITIDPEICHGKPCIRTLRYPVESVLEWLAGGTHHPRQSLGALAGMKFQKS